MFKAFAFLTFLLVVSVFIAWLMWFVSWRMLGMV